MALSLSSYDISLLQETHLYTETENKLCESQWPGKCFWSNGHGRAKGVAILVKAHVNLVAENVHADTDGRLLVLDATLNGVKWRIINVYCPNDVHEREPFLESLAQYLSTSRVLLVGGDFNFVDNLTLDKVGGRSRDGNEGAEIWRQVRRCGNLSDLFRRFHKTNVITTWTSGDGQVSCRLDRFYVAARIQSAVTDINVSPSSDSDHSFVCISIALSGDPVIGPGYWKCNVKTLDDPHFNADLEALWDDLTLEPNKDLVWWESCKVAFKRLIICHSCRLANNRKSELQHLNNKLRLLSVTRPITADISDEISELKIQINNLLDVKVEGAKVRSKIQFLDNEEKPTRVFLQKAQSRVQKSHIVELNVAGRKVTEPLQLLDACRSYYRQLYTAESIDAAAATAFIDGLPRLTPARAQQCEGPLTAAECWNAIKGMKPFKTPGSDGLPKEFYQRFFRLFGNDFVDVINQAFEDGQLSPSQRLGYITLICKDKDHADQLGNWRPVSLLNVDYKIVSKSLSNRLCNVIGDVVMCDQTCAIPGRSAQDNIHLLRNLIDYCNNLNLPCFLVSYDQAKAFDRVSHEYLFMVLKVLGFGDNFIQWVKLLYTNIGSRVIVNGYLSEFFDVLRSMRQGCGLSALLYVLCIEPLAHRVRNSLDIRGIRLPGCSEELRISLFADDTTTVSADVESVNNCIKVFEHFSAASGAALNKSKCAVLVVGGQINTAGLPAWLPVKVNVKICGVIFGRNMVAENEAVLLPKIATAVRLNQGRTLTLRGRVTVLNVVICAKLWYVGSGVNFSSNFLTRLDKILFSFLSKAKWVNRHTLLLPPAEGGLGVYSITARLAAFRVDHLRRLINGPSARWQVFARFWVGLSLRQWAPQGASNLLPHSEWRPEYYSLALGELRTLCAGLNSLDPLTLRVKKAYPALLDKYTLPPVCMRSAPGVDFAQTWRRLEESSLDPMSRDVMWRLVHRILPVRSILVRFKITSVATCPLCRQQGSEETVKHLFLFCTVVQLLRQCLNECIKRCIGSILLLTEEEVLYLNLPSSLNPGKGAAASYLISEAVYATWINRNAAAFEGKVTRPRDLKGLFLSRLRARLKADSIRFETVAFRLRYGTLATTANGSLVLNLPH